MYVCGKTSVYLVWVMPTIYCTKSKVCSPAPPYLCDHLFHSTTNHLIIIGSLPYFVWWLHRYYAKSSTEIWFLIFSIPPIRIYDRFNPSIHALYQPLHHILIYQRPGLFQCLPKYLTNLIVTACHRIYVRIDLID